MRVLVSVAAVALGTACQSTLAVAQQSEPANQLVREVVYNELHDHNVHGNWRYWVRQRLPEGTKLAEQIETHEGPVTRVLMVNGHPVDEATRRTELAKLDALITSPAEQQNARQAYADDERRIGRIMAMLPEAFLFEEAGQEKDCRHLRFRPDPAYSAHNLESRVFRSIRGDLWVDTRMKRLLKLEGHWDNDLNFGFGLLGRVNKGSWFRFERTQVSATDWKMRAVEVHISGRAVLFKTLAHDTSEVRGGFTPLPAELTLSQGARLLSQAIPINAEAAAAQIAPISLVKRK